VVFNRNCFPKMKDYSRLRPPSPIKAVTYTLNAGVGLSKKWCRIDTLLTYYTPLIESMVYQLVPFPVTLDDVEGHSPVARLIKCNSTNICATFRAVITDMARRAVCRR